MRRKFNIVTKLLIVNIAVFLILNIIHVILYLFNSEEIYQKIITYIAVPSELKTLVFRFWTPLTYMFVHESFWHILGNMLWLYFLGIMLIEHIKEKDFLSLYLLGGLSGALAYIIAFNIFPSFSDIKIFSVALGASASVTAIVIAMATLKPQQEVYLYGILKIKLIYIAAFMLIYDIFLLQSSNAGGHFAHLGGAIYGFWFAKQYKKGKNIQKKFSDFISKIFKIDFRHKTKMKVVVNNLRTKDDFQYNKTINDINAEIDRILEKISQYGYNSLSKKEKDFLKNNSNKIK
jgi:membrane associated rhomboid family serine protease